ncbi:MAG: tryptophan 2,3-dioxygenase family protein [Candidatus Sericytochromatia bacterium]|nr:tryptophan 2,3-dioxygenase family protein [Candidatus Sericytochromatia bacterium]
MSQEPAVYKPTDLTYGNYLKVPQLLSLQQLQSNPPHHDEMLFIVIHQAYELWFKLILLELENAMAYMGRREVLRAHHFLRRVVEIQKVLVSQIHILETMTPIEFLGFRDHLNPASGFQSFQFRELEFIAGLVDESYYDHFIEQSGLDNLRQRAAHPGLWACYQKLLADLGFPVPAPMANQPSEGPERDQLLKVLASLYEHPEAQMELYMLSEALVDFDTQLGLWRFHHVSVVERVIGHKVGTGGSSGSGYLRSTLTKRCFPLLFEARSLLGGAAAAPYGASPTAERSTGGPPTGGCPFH